MATRHTQQLRIGHGYDLHRLEPVAPAGQGRPLILAGVRIEHDKGPVGHSDGDAVLHAVTDAILGALAEPDIGQLFPDTAPENAGRNSAEFLREATKRMTAHGYAIGNLDITIICEKPKIGPHKQAMIATLAKLLACEASQINIKGKTHDRVDAVGEGRAIEVHVIALLAR
jgi:2-C-methyl-D-erythritol 2,4-cyclodiphosphate synthase